MSAERRRNQFRFPENKVTALKIESELRKMLIYIHDVFDYGEKNEKYYETISRRAIDIFRS